jgi:hypothetical protein
MLGHASELDKGCTYSADDWDTPRRRVKSIKKGRAGVVIKHDDGSTVELPNDHPVRFYEPGRDPRRGDD